MCESITKRLFFHVGAGGCLKQNSTVKGFTEYRTDDKTLFRAHPSYMIGEPWFDWALIQWTGNDALVPARLYLFLDLDEALVMSHEEHLEYCQTFRNRSRINLNDTEEYPYLDNGKWVVIQSAFDVTENDVEAVHEAPAMKMPMRFTLEEKLRIVPLKSICSKTFCVMDDPSSNNDNDLSGYCLNAYEDWGSAFTKYFS